MPFWTLSIKWLNKKAVPVVGQGVIKTDSETQKIKFKGTLDFNKDHPELTYEDKDGELYRYPVALAKFDENEMLHCVFIDPKNRSNYAVFVLKADIDLDE